MGDKRDRSGNLDVCQSFDLCATAMSRPPQHFDDLIAVYVTLMLHECRCVRVRCQKWKSANFEAPRRERCYRSASWCDLIHSSDIAELRCGCNEECIEVDVITATGRA